MDWHFIDNAQGARFRVVGLLYLCRERYGLDATEAGQRLRERFGGAAYCEQLIAEAAAMLASDQDISMGAICPPDQARRYLSDLVVAYHARVGRNKMLDLARRAIRRYGSRQWAGFPRAELEPVPTDDLSLGSSRDH